MSAGLLQLQLLVVMSVPNREWESEEREAHFASARMHGNVVSWGVPLGWYTAATRNAELADPEGHRNSAAGTNQGGHIGIISAAYGWLYFRIEHPYRENGEWVICIVHRRNTLPLPATCLGLYLIPR